MKLGAVGGVLLCLAAVGVTSCDASSPGDRSDRAAESAVAPASVPPSPSPSPHVTRSYTRHAAYRCPSRSGLPPINPTPVGDEFVVGVRHGIEIRSATHPAVGVSLPFPARAKSGVGSPTWSPDGTKILATVGYFGGIRLRCTGPKGSGEFDGIAVWRADGSSFRWVYAAGVHDRSISDAVWGADGKTAYFSREPGSFSHHGPAPHVQLLSVQIGRRRFTPQPVDGGQDLDDPAVSPDGKQIAGVRVQLSQTGIATRMSLVTLDLATGRVSRPLLTSTGRSGLGYGPLADPAWSPDGHRIAITRALKGSDPQGGERSEIDVVAADGSSRGVPLVAASGGEQAAVNSPAWHTEHELWFTQGFVSYEFTDEDEHTQPRDLFSVQIDGNTVMTPVRRTATAADEGRVSFLDH